MHSARHVISYHLMGPMDIARHVIGCHLIGLMDSALHVIARILDPPSFCSVASCDVASTVH